MIEQQKKKLFLIALCLSAAVMFFCVWFFGESRSQGLKTGLAYFSGSSAQPGTALTVIVLDYPMLRQPTYEWRVGGELVDCTEASYTPTEADQEKMITVTIRARGYEDLTLSAFCSRLPVFYINVEGGSEITDKGEYLNASYVFQGAGEYAGDCLEGSLQIKRRGNYSFYMPKGSYKIKLDSRENLQGMGENKHWLLLANFTDISLMRNVLANQASAKMGMTAMDSQWVEVVLNGEYAGVYQLCEQIRPGEDRVDVLDWEQIGHELAEACMEQGVVQAAPGEEMETLAELKETLENDLGWMDDRCFTFREQEYQIPDDFEIPPIMGGFILELDEYYDEPSRLSTPQDQPVMFHSPANAWTSLELMDYALNYVVAIETAIYAEDHQAEWMGMTVHYSNLMDMDSLVKYFLVSEFFFNEDFGRRSMYMYKDLEGICQMGPIWDMDWSSNGQGDTTYYDRWATLYFAQAHPGETTWYQPLIKDADFISRAYELYWEYRYVLEEMTADGGIIDQYYQYLYEPGLANEALWFNGKGFTEEVQEKLKPWMKNRLAWMDEQFASVETLTASLNPQ